MGMTVHLGKNDEFEFDENSDKMMLDALRVMIEKEARDGVKYKPNEKRVSEFFSVCKEIESIYGNKDHEIKISKSEISADGWFITVRGKTISIEQPKRMTDRVLRVADNFEFTPNTDGTIEFGFGFYGMVDRIK